MQFEEQRVQACWQLDLSATFSYTEAYTGEKPNCLHASEHFTLPFRNLLKVLKLPALLSCEGVLLPISQDYSRAWGQKGGFWNCFVENKSYLSNLRPDARTSRSVYLQISSTSKSSLNGTEGHGRWQLLPVS